MSVTGWLALLAGLVGCAQPMRVHTPTATELRQVEHHDRSLVLWQSQVRIGGVPVYAWSKYDDQHGYRHYLVNLDTMSAPTEVDALAPTEAAAVDGWRYLLLPTGTYFLLAVPPGTGQNPPAVAFHAPTARFGRLTSYQFQSGRGGFWEPELRCFVLTGDAPADFEPVEGLWFEVPKDAEAIYLGSLSTECLDGRGVFGDLLESCEETTLRVDQEAARATLSSFASELKLESQPLTVMGRLRSGVQLRDLERVAVSVRAPAFAQVDFTGAELGPWGVIPGAGQAIGLFNLAAIGVEAASRSAADSHANQLEASAKPCMDELASAAQSFQYEGQLVSALASEVRSRRSAVDFEVAGPSSAQGTGAFPQYTLTVTFPVLRLREVGQSGELALEMALEARLEARLGARLGARLDSPDGASPLYRSTLYYAPWFAAHNPMTPHSALCARLVPTQSTARTVSEWCGAGGAELLRGEIATALKQLAAEVVRELDASP